MDMKFAADIVQFLSALIGLAGVVYSLKSVKNVNEGRKEKLRDPETVDSPMRVPRKIIVIAVTSLIILVADFGILAWRYLLSDSIKIEITYPFQGNHVEINETIKGTSQNIQANQMIWVVIYSPLDKKYFPHEVNATLDVNGDWTSPNTVIGASTDAGNEFQILALLATKSTQQYFHEYFSTPTRSGLNNLPEGEKIYDQITVTRK